MNFSQIFKYQVHAANLSLSTPLENLVGISPVHKSGRKGCCHAILEEEKKKTREKRALLASAPVHKSGRWEARERVAVMLFYRKKKAKQKATAC